MSENIVTAPVEGNDPPAKTEPETNAPPKAPETDTVDWKAEAEKWKALSRKHEGNWKSVSAERDELKQASMTDAEKALEAAKAAGRAEAASEYAEQLAGAQLAAKAATAGVEIPESMTQFMDPKKFLGSDGKPDSAAIDAFVASLSGTRPAFPQNVGAGRQGETNQLTHADLQNMTPAQINKARKEGRLDHLMYGSP